MKDPSYLYSVLALSGLPKALTFALTAISFPLMVHALGAAEYGVMVYLTSIIGLLELAAGFGVASATGKALAECRTSRPSQMRTELHRWGRLQLWVFGASALPACFAAFLFIQFGGHDSRLDSRLFALVFLTMYVATSVTFGRAALTSMLAFKQLAVLDTVESVVRSAGWLVVGLWFPTALSLAWAALLTSAVALTLAGLLLRRVTKLDGASPARDDGAARPLTMLRESATFMALSLGTRTYQALPILLVGRMLGLEVTGVLGAFTKLVEIVSLPFTVVGNALMVRAPELKQRGNEALRRYWDMLSKLAIVALMLFFGCWLMSAQLAVWLLPDSLLAAKMFGIASALVLARSVSDLFAPASDYVGGLRRRIVFLTACSALQLPFIWLAAHVAGAVGATAVIVASYSAMVAGYVLIARRVFFGAAKYRPPDVAVGAAAVTAIGAVLSITTAEYWPWRVGLFAGFVLGVFLAVPALRNGFWPTRIMRFDFE